jgi:hypothetical protein
MTVGTVKFLFVTILIVVPVVIALREFSRPYLPPKQRGHSQ